MHFSRVLVTLYRAIESSLCKLLNFFNIAEILFKDYCTYMFIYVYTYMQHNKACFNVQKSTFCSKLYSNQVNYCCIFFYGVFKNNIFSENIFISFSNDTIYLNCFKFQYGNLELFFKQHNVCIFLINYFTILQRISLRRL